jgi:hypothetical protein
VIARRLASMKIKDYLIITAIRDTRVGIALSTSALEPTYGVAAHSLVMLSSYMFSIGFYICAISLSQDSSLRKSIRRSNIGLIDNIGTAQVEQELREKILKIVEDAKDKMEEQTGGISYSLTEKDVSDYMELVIDERRHSTILNKEQESKKKDNEENIGNNPHH